MKYDPGENIEVYVKADLISNRIGIKENHIEDIEKPIENLISAKTRVFLYVVHEKETQEVNHPVKETNSEEVSTVIVKNERMDIPVYGIDNSNTMDDYLAENLNEEDLLLALIETIAS